tara:strand:- start:755 stop:1003 length:249 start_codon:yes stop_codon:yes gene_type:complete
MNTTTIGKVRAKQECAACSAPTRFLYCDPCSIFQIEQLLKSGGWLTVAATRQDDYPGGTMVVIIKRELRTLKAQQAHNNQPE